MSTSRGTLRVKNLFAENIAGTTYAGLPGSTTQMFSETNADLGIFVLSELGDCAVTRIKSYACAKNDYLEQHSLIIELLLWNNASTTKTIQIANLTGDTRDPVDSRIASASQLYSISTYPQDVAISLSSLPLGGLNINIDTSNLLLSATQEDAGVYTLVSSYMVNKVH